MIGHPPSRNPTRIGPRIGFSSRFYTHYTHRASPGLEILLLKSLEVVYKQGTTMQTGRNGSTVSSRTGWDALHCVKFHLTQPPQRPFKSVLRTTLSPTKGPRVIYVLSASQCDFAPFPLQLCGRCGVVWCGVLGCAPLTAAALRWRLFPPKNPLSDVRSSPTNPPVLACAGR